jgi:hypothetical protein
MKKQNLIYIVGGLGILYYFFMRNKSASMLTNDNSTSVIKKDIYPMGLKELDLVANSVEIAQLYQGKLRPVTAAYVNRFLPNSWERTITIPDVVYREIPRGAVLDI